MAQLHALLQLHQPPLLRLCEDEPTAFIVGDPQKLIQLPALRLVYGIGATLGIEAFVWLTDMAGLSREEAVEVMRSNAHTLLRAAMANL